MLSQNCHSCHKLSVSEVIYFVKMNFHTYCNFQTGWISSVYFFQDGSFRKYLIGLRKYCCPLNRFNMFAYLFCHHLYRYYHKKFDDYPKDRKAFIPFLIWSWLVVVVNILSAAFLRIFFIYTLNPIRGDWGKWGPGVNETLQQVLSSLLK